MAGYSDMAVATAKAKAAASGDKKDKENSEKIKKAYGDTEPAKAPVAAKKQEAPKPEPKKEVEETYIENSNEAVAKAKPGDKIKRSDGTVVTLTQADIDAAQPKKEEVKAPVKAEPAKEPAGTMPPNMDEDSSKEATNEIANRVGIDPEETKSEEGLHRVVESGAATRAFETLKPEVLDASGKPFDKSAFDGTVIGSGNKPEDGLAWYQQIAPILTVLSVAASAIAISNGAFVPPINFNKITNRDEAYNAYLDVITADQKDENITQNERDDIVSSLELKEGLEEAKGPGAWTEATKARGDIAEAGNIAVQREAAGQNLEAMAKQHGFNLETLDKEQQNTLAQMEKQGELDAYMAQVTQTFNLETIDANTKAQLAVLEKQSENDLAMARVMSELEASLDARAIQALQGAGLDVNGYAQWMKGRSGRTTADTVNDYINSVSGAVGNVVDPFIPG